MYGWETLLSVVLLVNQGGQMSERVGTRGQTGAGTQAHGYGCVYGYGYQRKHGYIISTTI